MRQTIEMKYKYYSWYLNQKYYLQYLWDTYVMGWKTCTECGHKNSKHYWADKVYCAGDGSLKGCSCGYHCGR